MCGLKLCEVSQVLLVYTVVWYQELCPAAGCQTHIHFCPVSQAISSPYVTVNAYRDTAPCLSVQICALEEDEAICLLVMSSKLISYFFTCWYLLSFPTLRATPAMFLGGVENESFVQ